MPEENELDNKKDEELVELILENQSYFLHIVKRYKTKLLSYIRRISNVSQEEAEDLLQDVFLKVFVNLNDFDDGLKFSSWIYRITHNVVIDNFRKTKSRPQMVELDMNSDRIKHLADDFDIERSLDSNFLKIKIQTALGQLDLKYRDILILKYLEEKDYQEISDIIKKPIGTVASRINKAKQELKKVLKKSASFP
ncbi:RNA polymerase sigma factor [Candidatus Parcubacteria bacterium]|nr:RNA polymerase sigma factor [Patescibacteria group bacterium]MBU4308909.1 RNA polymerase sigma factor [Patescibacteria group bacterium]MBU4432589.1 RNA polymerase sigma factor [Patescibacteria group bacterium]MBU4577269.1 RNA polymerase sigma factor [Patescibacteria group bacterium]MCG2696959.1 RNA polymerase sigma factor [Candidatus Parcubacteria bacterium]